MPPAQAIEAYELRSIENDGRAVSAGVFTPEADGSRTVLVMQGLKGTRDLVVPAEPGPDGSPAPTQQPQLTGAVT